MVPVRVREVDPSSLPEALGKIHLLPAEGAFDFDRHFTPLIETLNTDHAWLKDSTRLADRARQWIAKDRCGEDGLQEEPDGRRCRGHRRPRSPPASTAFA